jgi:hypothetical protein
LRASYAITMVTCLGADPDTVDDIVRLLERQRRRAPGFIPIVVQTTVRSTVAAELGIETALIMDRSQLAEKQTGSWEDYAQHRIHELAAQFDVDNIVPADPYHPDAWITLQQRRSVPKPKPKPKPKRATATAPPAASPDSGPAAAPPEAGGRSSSPLGRLRKLKPTRRRAKTALRLARARVRVVSARCGRVFRPSTRSGSDRPGGSRQS